jgi:hypothetical protein
MYIDIEYKKTVLGRVERILTFWVRSEYIRPYV